MQIKTSKTKSQFSYGILIPGQKCKLKSSYLSYLSFASKHPEVLLCFIKEDDVVERKAPKYLNTIKAKNLSNICIYPGIKTNEKEKVVTEGMDYVNQHFDVKLLGYLDNNSTIRPDEWLKMAASKFIP